MTIRDVGSAPFADHPDVVATRRRLEMNRQLAELGLIDPYLQPHDGVNTSVLRAHGRDLVNFSSYNYLGMAGDPRVGEGAKAAIDRYGTSVSASRVVSGEIPLYAQLEQDFAAVYDVDAAIVTSCGFTTNAALIGFLLGPEDLMVCDSLIHNSIVSGTRWAGCRRINFRHNDPTSLEAVLRMARQSANRAMVVVEGLYSMDGDIAPLPDIIEAARRFDCAVMVDEAHSFGLLGERGLGVREHYGLPGDAVDIWMGTMSKSLGSCGGYLAGSHELITALKYYAPGLSMHTVGANPAAIGAASAALSILRAEPERVRTAQDNGRYLWQRFTDRGVDVGSAQGTPIVPAILHGDVRAALTSMMLIREGVNVNAILPPAVPEGGERLRFFATSEHTPEQLDIAVDALEAVHPTVDAMMASIVANASHEGRQSILDLELSPIDV
jgi:8-amino-7-oxononanoate synthase